MSPRVVIGCVLISALMSACERKTGAKPPETAAVAPETIPAAPPAKPVVRVSTWDTTAGPVMFVRGNSPAEAYVVFPAISDSTPSAEVHFDSAVSRNAAVDLFQRAGTSGVARVGALGGGEWDANQCIEWPAAKVQPAASADGGSGWTVGFLKGHARALPLDTVESMAHADSARLVADITRLVSTVPNDTARTFRGIPYSVRTAYRFTPVPGVEAVVADVVRTLNQEANPLEEHTLVVGERPAGSNAP